MWSTGLCKSNINFVLGEQLHGILLWGLFKGGVFYAVNTGGNNCFYIIVWNTVKLLMRLGRVFLLAVYLGKIPILKKARFIYFFNKK